MIKIFILSALCAFAPLFSSTSASSASSAGDLSVVETSTTVAEQSGGGESASTEVQAPTGFWGAWTWIKSKVSAVTVVVVAAVAGVGTWFASTFLGSKKK